MSQTSDGDTLIARAEQWLERSLGQVYDARVISGEELVRDLLAEVQQKESAIGRSR